MTTLDEVLAAATGRSRTVLEYSQTTKRLVDAAKDPDFTSADWAPLAELIDVDNFVRVGPFKEVMDWTSYAEFLTNWAKSSEWDCEFQRLTETPDVAFLELEERSKIGDFSSTVNSLSVYEFTEVGKIRHIDLYLQMPLPQPEMFKSFDGVELLQ